MVAQMKRLVSQIKGMSHTVETMSKDMYTSIAGIIQESAAGTKEITVSI